MAADPRESGPAPAGSHAAEVAREAPAAEHPHHGIVHDDHLAHAFFEAEDRTSHDDGDDDHYVIPTLSRGSRRAMYASLGIFGFSALVIGAYSIYQNLVMPAPVELGATMADLPALIPTPIAAPARAEPQLAHPSLAAPVHETQLSAATTLPALEVPRLNAAPATQAPVAQAPKVEPAAPAAPAAPAEPEKPAVVAAAPSPAAAPLAAQGPVGQAADTSPAAPAPVVAAASGVAGAPTYDELVAVGRALSKKNRRNEASEAFRRALLQAPQGSAALSGLSFVYLNSNERQNAREFAQRAVQADASNAEGWIVLGAALELLGDRAGARDAYRACVERGQGPYLVECRRVAR